MLNSAFPLLLFPFLLPRKCPAQSPEQVSPSPSGFSLVLPPCWQDIPRLLPCSPGLSFSPGLESPSLTCLAGRPQQHACPGVLCQQKWLLGGRESPRGSRWESEGGRSLTLCT